MSTNKSQRTDQTSDIFPLTVKFNDRNNSRVRYRTLMGLDAEGTKTTSLLVYDRSRGSSRPSNIHSHTIQCDTDEAFEECVAARQEGRYADLTKLQPKPQG